MKKTWALGICAAAVVSVAVGGAGIASASPDASHRGGPSTFTVFSHNLQAQIVSPCSTCAMPPLPAGSVVSAQYLNDPVFDQETGGRQIGVESVVVNVVSSDASTALLSGAVTITDAGMSGQIIVSGEIDARAGSGVVAVTGGTGSFEGAKGELAYSGAGLSSHVTTLVVDLDR